MGTNRVTTFVGVARQQHVPVPSPTRARGKRPSTSDSQENSSQKARRDRRPNWSLNEMIALVDAKRDEFLEELDVIDGRDIMDSEVTKWNRISEKIWRRVFLHISVTVWLVRVSGTLSYPITAELRIIMLVPALTMKTIGIYLYS